MTFREVAAEAEKQAKPAQAKRDRSISGGRSCQLRPQPATSEANGEAQEGPRGRRESRGGLDRVEKPKKTRAPRKRKAEPTPVAVPAAVLKLCAPRPPALPALLRESAGFRRTSAS
jgi:hypothetical protein